MKRQQAATHLYQQARGFVQTLPVILLGLTAWYLGMAQTYWKQAFANHRQS